MDNEKVIALNNQLELFRTMVDRFNPQRGSYFIEDISADRNGLNEAMLSRLLTMLTMTFHEYIWKQTYSFDPKVKGVLIQWIPKNIS